MAKRVLTKLVEKAAARLRQEGYQAKGVGLDLRATDRSRWSGRCRAAPFNDTPRSVKYIFSILTHCPISAPPLLLAVSFFDLTPARAQQLSLFDPEQKLADLTRAIDRLNDHYGLGTVRFGRHLGIDQAAPTRIAFGKPG
jgi:DNA polymerase-4